MQTYNSENLPNYAVAAGATTNPPVGGGAGALCWSATLKTVMVWTATAWQPLFGATQSPPPPAEPFFYRAGWWRNSVGVQVNTALTIGTAYAFPIVLPVAVTLEGLRLNVTTAGTASVIRAGIYSVDAGNLPSTLIQDFGTVSGAATGTQSFTISTPLALAAGVYWFAVACNSGTTAPTIQCLGSSGNLYPLPTASPQTAVAAAYTMTGVTGAMPTTFTSGTTVITAPRLFPQFA